MTITPLLVLSVHGKAMLGHLQSIILSEFPSLLFYSFVTAVNCPCVWNDPDDLDSHLVLFCYLKLNYCHSIPPKEKNL